MRFIFIHGLGETESCFSQIAPNLEGEQVFISLWDSLVSKRRGNLDVLDFCRELIEKHSIQPEDVIIGHSTGGRIAYFIKHLNGNTVIQIASWTKDGKPKFPIDNRHVIFFLVRSGILFTSWGGNYMMNNYRNRDESKQYYFQALQNMTEGNRNCVVNQFKLALTPVKEEVTVEPDIRIHAKRDNIVRVPDEPFYEVPGDHFSLLTHPEEVLTGIRNLLTQVK